MLGMDFVCTDLMLDTGLSLYKILSPPQMADSAVKVTDKEFYQKTFVYKYVDNMDMF